MIFRDEMMDYKGELKLVLCMAFWQGEIFNLKDVIWMNREV